MSFTIGQRLKVANPSYSNDDLAGPYASIAQCEADFPTALLHEGRKVGIVQGDGRIKEYEWNLISQDPDEWELNPVQADADVDLTNYYTKPQADDAFGEKYTQAEKDKLAAIEDPKYKGGFPNLAALQTDFPEGTGQTWHQNKGGWKANVDGGVDEDVVEYLWDASDLKWVLQLGKIYAETPETIQQKYESLPDRNGYTNADKSKLNGIEAGAQVNTVNPSDIENFETGVQLNQRDTNNRNRANHTGTQTASTISDFNAAVSANFEMAEITEDADLSGASLDSLNAKSKSVKNANLILRLSDGLKANFHTIIRLGENGSLAVEHQTDIANVIGRNSFYNQEYVFISRLKNTNKYVINYFDAETAALPEPATGIEFTETPNLKFTTNFFTVVSFGILNVNGTDLNISGNNDYPFDALNDTTKRRFDIIAVDYSEYISDGSTLPKIVIIKGIEAESPNTPTLPTNHIAFSQRLITPEGASIDLQELTAEFNAFKAEVSDTYEEFRQLPENVVENLIDRTNWNSNNEYTGAPLNTFPPPNEASEATKENPYPPGTADGDKNASNNYFIQSGTRYNGDEEYYYVFESDNTPTRTPKAQTDFTTAEIAELSDAAKWTNKEFDNSTDPIGLVKGRCGYDADYYYKCVKSETQTEAGIVVRIQRV